MSPLRDSYPPLPLQGAFITLAKVLAMKGFAHFSEQASEREPLAKRRRTEITIQTHETVVLHHADPSARAWCAKCRAARDFVLPEEAARIAGVTVRTIFHRIEENRLHYLESKEGLMRICFESISKSPRNLLGGSKK